MFGDKSKRTLRVAKYSVLSVLALGGICVGTVGYVAGTVKYRHDVKWSSTPIGQELKFNRSKASLQLKGIYTDKSQNVLIAQLGLGENASALPFKGTDYRVFVKSPSTNGLQTIPILFGRMSTDGDMYLVLPNVTDQMYTIMIMNRNYISTDGLNTSGNISGQDIDDTKSLGKALSNYNSQVGGTNEGTFTIQNSKYDVVAMRLTLNPAFKTNRYQPAVINTDLLIDEGDTQRFDFETLFTTIYKNPTIESLNAEYQDANKKLDQANKALKAQEERVAANPNDSDALAAMRDAQNKQTEIQETMKSIAKRLTTYQALDYSDDLFTDILTKATVLNN